MAKSLRALVARARRFLQRRLVRGTRDLEKLCHKSRVNTSSVTRFWPPDGLPPCKKKT